MISLVQYFPNLIVGRSADFFAVFACADRGSLSFSLFSPYFVLQLYIDRSNPHPPTFNGKKNNQPYMRADSFASAVVPRWRSLHSFCSPIVSVSASASQLRPVPSAEVWRAVRMLFLLVRRMRMHDSSPFSDLANPRFPLHRVIPGDRGQVTANVARVTRVWSP